MKAGHLYFAGGAVLLVGLIFLLQKRNAASLGGAVGGAAVDLVVGTVQGAGTAIASAANDPTINPLRDFGGWVGTTIYDLTH